MDLKRYLRAQWDRAAAVAAALTGFVVLLLGWYGVSGQSLPAAQLPYIISGGLMGIFLLGVASVLWLSADLRDEWRKLDGIEGAILAVGNEGGVQSLSTNRVPVADTVPDEAPGPTAARTPGRHASGRQAL